jgi:hypothetical protein
MSVPKILAFLFFCLFAAIAIAGWWKREHTPSVSGEQLVAASDGFTVNAATTAAVVSSSTAASAVKELPLPPPVDRVEELFRTTDVHSPIVETITYKSHVPWLKGRPAWLSDYASHYRTSRHFIARSLNGKADYLKQDMSEGARFNVLRSDLRLQFNLVIDISRCQLWLYYQDLTHGEKVLLKSYHVGLGRPDANSNSGLLTPLGCYSLGDKVAIFKPKAMGLHQGQKTELIRVFGTRWIPFEEALGSTTTPAKGYGIHGIPWRENEKGEFAEDRSSIGSYTSDGCVRLATADMEEVFAIILTRPTVIEIVKDFHNAVFPVIETTN